MTIPPSNTHGALRALLSEDPIRQDDASILIRNQPTAYAASEASLLALTMITLVHAAPEGPSAKSMLKSVDSLDIFLPVLPIEVPAYASTLDRATGPDFIDRYCADIVDEANEERPDRPPLGSAKIIGPEAFLREVRSAFEAGNTTFTQGSPVENEAIALAASLGQLPRPYDLPGGK